MRQCIYVAILVNLWPTGGLIAVDAYEQLLLYMLSTYSLVFNAVSLILLPIKVGLATRTNT